MAVRVNRMRLVRLLTSVQNNQNNTPEERSEASSLARKVSLQALRDFTNVIKVRFEVYSDLTGLQAEAAEMLTNSLSPELLDHMSSYINKAQAKLNNTQPSNSDNGIRQLAQDYTNNINQLLVLAQS